MVGKGQESKKGKAMNDVEMSRGRRQRRPVPNMRSLPEKVAVLKLGFTEKQRLWVEQMGFGSIMEMDNLKLDRYLAFWLMERFDDRTAKLKLRENVELEIKANDVAWILGIPNGVVPVSELWKRDKLVVDLKSRYEKMSRELERPELRGFSCNAVLGCILPDIEYEEFKIHFLVYLLGTFLCPTQGNRLSPRVLQIVLSIGDPNEYDWAAFVLDELLIARRKVREKREDEGVGEEVDVNGFTGGYGGCLIVLVIFYLDRLKRRSVIGWGSKNGYRVRIAAWTKKTMDAAVAADYNESTKEFGNALLLDDPDLKYGEKHPDESRGPLYKDISKVKRSAVVYHKVNPRELKYPKRLNQINRVKNVVQNTVEEIEGQECSSAVVIGNDVASGRVRYVGSDGHHVNVKSVDEVDAVEVMDEGASKKTGRRTSKRIHSQNRERMSKEENMILKLIMDGGLAHFDKDYVVVRIPFLYVTRWEMISLVKAVGWVCDAVVSVWAIIKNLDWQGGGISRFIFDPHYGIMAMKEEPGSFLMKCISSNMLLASRNALATTNCTPLNCSHVFFPICEANHWWALHFDMQLQKIYVLDSSPSDNSLKLQKMIGNLQYLISYMVKDVRLHDWEVVDAKVPLKKNNHDCGALMMIVLEVWPCEIADDVLNPVVYGRRRIAVEMVKSARNLAREDVLSVAASLNY